MHKYDHNKVVFHSKQDMAGGRYLLNSEPILRSDLDKVPNNINDLLELYNIKLYIDNEVFLRRWSQNDIECFKKKVVEYAKVVGQFMSKIDDTNIISLHEELIHGYIESFWRLINHQKIFKQISPEKVKQILTKKPHEIRVLLKHKGIVERFNIVLSDFLLSYPQSAEILLSIFEVKKDFNKENLFLPKSLSLEKKENIINSYIDSENCNLNYLPIIQNAKKTNDFRVSDKTRLKAKRKYQEESNKVFKERSNDSHIHGAVSIIYPENTSKIKEVKIEGLEVNYSYSLDFIKKNSSPYSLYFNFKLLFEYLDNQNIINLINRASQVGVMERVIGVRSHNEYFCSTAFRFTEISSLVQIFTYSKLLITLGNSLEDILKFVYTSVFTEKYGYANNANLTFPTSNASALEKVRSLAPELESVLKQYKLFVEDNHIDFELLQMSSSPSSINDIPSLNENKYIYLDSKNQEAKNCSHFFFSDQTLLTAVEPFQKKSYRTFFDLLSNESEINFTNYEEIQKPELNYLIEKGYILVDENSFLQVPNEQRVLILKDLHENSVASFYHYPVNFQEEVKRMSDEKLIHFGSSLLSKPEQDYFNFYLNKSEFTNGLDLRNSYLHGTQANPSEINLHENSYFIYLKLLTLILLKIEDDLLIDRIKKGG